MNNEEIADNCRKHFPNNTKIYHAIREALNEKDRLMATLSAKNHRLALDGIALINDLASKSRAIEKLLEALKDLKSHAFANWQEPQGHRIGRETPEYWRGYQKANEDIGKYIHEAISEHEGDGAI